MEGLKGKTVLMFGGAGGIGAATSLRLSTEGANVLVGSLHEENAQAVARRITEAGGEARSVGVDIGDDDAVAAAVKTAVDTFGGLDAVHVNAANMAMEIITNDS